MKEKSMNYLIISAGVVLLLAASPLFAFYSIYPAVSSQIGPHQLASWISLFLGFIGFVFIIYGAARQNI